MNRTTIDPSKWEEFLAAFTDRNKGRRARFELFDHGSVSEEAREGRFAQISIKNRVVAVTRTYQSLGETKSMTDEIHDVHGIEVQSDTNFNEDTIEFSNHNGDRTILHFESLIDGDS